MNPNFRLPVCLYSLSISYCLGVIHQNSIRPLYRGAPEKKFLGSWPSQQILTVLGTFGDLTEVVKCAKFLINRSRDLCSASAWKSHVLMGKVKSSKILCSTQPRLHVMSIECYRNLIVNPYRSYGTLTSADDKCISTRQFLYKCFTKFCRIG